MDLRFNRKIERGGRHERKKKMAEYLAEGDRHTAGNEDRE